MIISLLAILSLPLITTVKANPVEVCWYVTDGGIPVDGAHLTIYWATSTSGPFSAMDSSLVEDKIAGTYQNPVITGYWNPDHPNGMAVVDLRITALSGYYFYVKIEANGKTWYWPTDGGCVPGNGIGAGPTSAWPTDDAPPPPNNSVPEVPLGPMVATASMLAAFVGYVAIRRRKLIR